MSITGTAAPKQYGIDAALTDLATNKNRLQDALIDLRGRLQPVSVPEDEGKAVAGEVCEQKALSPIADSIQRHAGEVLSMARMVEGLIQRLDT